MRLNMKANWSESIFEAMNATRTEYIGCSAVWIDRRKISLLDKLYIKNGFILPQKETPGNEYTHMVKKLEGAIDNSKHRIYLENVLTNEIETIDL